MCTVSFVRHQDGVIITSNRDEHETREYAAAPDFRVLPHKKIIFPKDARAGGTWFAASSTGVVAVLLNGAFQKHVPQPPYRTSRGLILLQIIEANEPVSFFDNLDLFQIEPFTLVLYQQGLLYELRWDGTTKHQQLLDIDAGHIWSSATLYTDEVVKNREQLFQQFIHTTAAIAPESLYDFHAQNRGDAENGFVIDRQTGMKTFSITQAVLKNDSIIFNHHDLLQHKQYTASMPVTQLEMNNNREAV